ncbi:UbiA prenyltransferase family-domain-containing protein, partial [Xylariaceae sp. FL1651]
LLSFLYTLYLFTFSDFITVLLPQTLFALFSVLSNKFMATTPSFEVLALHYRILPVVLWIWLQLLVLDVANQRLPDSIAEDIMNKPWRPITSGRITVEGARWLLISSIVVTFATSCYFGVASEALLLFTLNWMYNDLGLANSHRLPRNLLNALGITMIGVGATSVAGKGLAFLRVPAASWSLLCAGMLVTTIHAQDIYDQQGDAARDRSTVPLVFGDTAARWSVAVGVLFWSVVMPAYLNILFYEQWVVFFGPVLLGIMVAARILTLRGIVEDKRTFGFWAAWTISIYSLPLLAL